MGRTFSLGTMGKWDVGLRGEIETSRPFSPHFPPFPPLVPHHFGALFSAYNTTFPH